MSSGARYHAVRVVDLNSHNGTLVNGEKIAEYELAQNDQLQLGASIFLFRNADDLLASDASTRPNTP